MKRHAFRLASLLIVSTSMIATNSPGPAWAEATPRQRCEAAKIGALGKYSACLHKAQQKFVAGGELAEAARDAALLVCGDKYQATWKSIEDKAGMGVCPSEGDASSVQKFLDACILSTDNAVGGGALLLDVVACNVDLASCSADLAAADAGCIGNNAPSFTKGADQHLLDNFAAQAVPGWATAIYAGSANEAGQTITFAITGNSNPGLFLVQPTVAPDGTLTFTPDVNAPGAATITVMAMDNGGTANGGSDTSVPQSFVITASRVDVSAPPAAFAGQSLTITADVTGDGVEATTITAECVSASLSCDLVPLSDIATPALRRLAYTDTVSFLDEGDSVLYRFRITDVFGNQILRQRSVTVLNAGN